VAAMLTTIREFVFSSLGHQQILPTSDECLNYALDNRREWENKGKNIVEELVSSFITRETEETPGPKLKKNRFARRRSLMTSGG
jgi:hypothetical protein